MFPGQGAQQPGMLATLPDSAMVRDTLETASQTLDDDILALDTAEALAETRAVQIALMVVGVAAARHLIEQGAPPAATIGLSIGAWPAAVIAGAMDFSDALRLVAERGRLMGDAYPHGYGMAAVIGLSVPQVDALLERLNAAGQASERLYLANVNSDQQIVVAGCDADLARLAESASEAGAQRVQRLAMAVPSHCPLLDAPAGALADAAEPQAFGAPRLAYFSANRRRRLWTAADLRDDLVYNMARTVYWGDTARIVDESGFRLAVEMLPGRTLTRLHPAVEAPGEAIAVADAGWDNAAALIRRAE